MNKEQINDKEAICLLTVFIVGSTLIIGIGGEVNNDKWITGIIGLFLAMPIVLIYARLQSIFQGQDIFDILKVLFGRIGGRIISLIYVWYALHLGSLVTRNFGEFVNVVALPETPMLVPMLAIGMLAVYAVKLGIEVLGRLCSYMLPNLLIILVTVLLLGIPEMKFHHLKPILASGFAPLLKSGFTSFSFPFAETVLFLGVFFTLKTKKSPYKVYFSGLIFAGTIILITTIRNVLLLGELGSSLYFPTHVAVGRITVGVFLQRIEVAVAFVFAVASLIKISISLFVAVKGLSKIFNLNDYRSVVIQTGLLMILFAQILYDDIMSMTDWAMKIYPYYAFPFQVILPIGIWIMAEVKKNKINVGAENASQS